jgi:hypothetical protein
VDEPLEKLRLGQALHDPPPIRNGIGLLHTSSDPLTAIAKAHVHELDADRTAVDPAPTIRLVPGGVVEIRMGQCLQPPQRVEVRLEVAPTTESVGQRVLEEHRGFLRFKRSAEGHHNCKASRLSPQCLRDGASRVNGFLSTFRLKSHPEFVKRVCALALKKAGVDPGNRKLLPGPGDSRRGGRSIGVLPRRPDGGQFRLRNVGQRR